MKRRIFTTVVIAVFLTSCGRSSVVPVDTVPVPTTVSSNQLRKDLCYEEVYDVMSTAIERESVMIALQEWGASSQIAFRVPKMYSEVATTWYQYGADAAIKLLWALTRDACSNPRIASEVVGW